MTHPWEPWDFSPPTPSDLGDRQVPLDSAHLAGRRVALLVSGSIAALRAPDLARALRRRGAAVTAFVSAEGLRYVTREVLEWSTGNPAVTQLTAAAEHLSDDRPFDAYLLAPATYNTINKFRHGIADGVLTSTLASALGRLAAGTTKIAIAPTLHGSLHTPLLVESLTTLRSLGVEILRPRDAYGKHNLPDPTAIAVAVARSLSRSPLAGVPVLVTGGPTPVPLDGVRRLTNRFTGRLGLAIAVELHLRGADVWFVCGDSGLRPPDYLPHEIASTYDAYRERVLGHLGDRGAAGPVRFGVFSAAVADYRPETVAPGKRPSGGDWPLQLVPTAKVIDEVRAAFPDLGMVSFKYQENCDRARLFAIARERLARGHRAVVANRGEDFGPAGEQVAYLVTGEGEPLRLEGKPDIARALAAFLERQMAIAE